MYVITGGSKGIGKHLALNLAKNNKDVLIIGRSKSCLQKTSTLSNKIQFLQADVSLPEEREKICRYLQNNSQISALVHNAGIINPITSIDNLTEESWNKCFATNLNAPLFLSKSLKNKLHNGKILHIGTKAAYFPIVGWSAYCTSKAALAMLNKCWQIENDSIAVTSVMPGIIDTDMQKIIRESTYMDNDKHEFFMQLHKEKKLIKPEVVASFLSWLLLEVDNKEYVSQEWDIYDKTHHNRWLKNPHILPEID